MAKYRVKISQEFVVDAREPSTAEDIVMRSIAYRDTVTAKVGLASSIEFLKIPELISAEKIEKRFEVKRRSVLRQRFYITASDRDEARAHLDRIMSGAPTQGIDYTSTDRCEEQVGVTVEETDR